MNEYVIPVVYSGAELSRFLPPKSYIDANDFETAEDLANHLLFLSQNPHEYIKYFWWKRHYQIVAMDDTQRMICAMCQKINELNFSLKRQTYSDVSGWFYKGACSKPKIKF
jgi:alpha-1,3-fucosyltransferase